MDEKVKISTKYLDYLDILLTNSIIKLPKYINKNNYAINIKLSK